MKRALAWPLEFLHLAGAAFFFGVGALLMLLTSPNWLARVSAATPESAARTFNALTGALNRNSLWLAGAALAGAIAAPHLRGDGKKRLAWARVLCMGGVMLVVVLTWGRLEGAHATIDSAVRSDRGVTFWNALAGFAALDLGLAAWALGGAGAKPPSDGKK